MKFSDEDETLSYTPVITSSTSLNIICAVLKIVFKPSITTWFSCTALLTNSNAFCNMNIIPVAAAIPFKDTPTFFTPFALSFAPFSTDSKLSAVFSLAVTTSFSSSAYSFLSLSILLIASLYFTYHDMYKMYILIINISRKKLVFVLAAKSSPKSVQLGI